MEGDFAVVGCWYARIASFCTRNSAEWCVQLLNCKIIELFSNCFDAYVKKFVYLCVR